MNGLDMRRYEMLVRVREFGSTHADLFPPPTLGGQAFAAVATAVTELSQQAASQFSGRGMARGGTATKAAAREALRQDLDAITRTARAIALDVPGLADTFRQPRGTGDLALLNAARAFARDAAPLATQFIQYDMPSDFLDGLSRDILAFEEAIRGRDAGKDTHVAARAALDTAMEAGLNAVRRLDAIVPNRLKTDAAAVAVWERARRVEYRSSRKGEVAAPVPPDSIPPLPDTSASAAVV